MGGRQRKHYRTSASSPCRTYPGGDQSSSCVESHMLRSRSGKTSEMCSALTTDRITPGNDREQQADLNAELTLARWDGQTPITAFRDHMKALRTRLAAAGPTITPQQFYQYFINSLPAAVHDPGPSNHSVDVLCDAFRAIELRKELRTSTTGSTPVGLLAKQKGSKGSGKAESGRKSGSTGGKGKKSNVTCYGCGKKGHYKHECRSAKEGDKSGTTSGTNTHANSSGNTSTNKSTPALCLMETHDVAYSMNTNGKAQYYLDTFTSSHFIEEVDALHSYTPFEVPRSITTAESGTIPSVRLWYPQIHHLRKRQRNERRIAKRGVAVKSVDFLNEMARGTGVKVILHLAIRVHGVRDFMSLH